MSSGMDFGAAIKAMEAGKRVAQEGWSGSYLYLVRVHGIQRVRSYDAGNKQDGPFFANYTHMLGKDWRVVE